MSVPNECPRCGKVKPMAEWICVDCGAKMPSYGHRDWMQAELGAPPYVADDKPGAALGKAQSKPPLLKDTPITWKNGPPIVAAVLFLSALLTMLLDGKW